MVFQNQFALSLELTRLLPPIKWATDKTVEAIMTRARGLSNSGSDIVVEEDLARVLGRCKIADGLSSSFRSIITKSTSNVPIVEAIMLQGGPGPTVIRAFQDSYYFSMVVQLSLLVWVFPINDLATAIAEALRERAAGAPSTSDMQSTPSRNGILGVLRACESQTSAFNWNLMLNAVSNTLGYRTGPAPMGISDFVLRGLLDMLPMVQTLPKDRFIHIQIPVAPNRKSGTTALIVWAHHVLGLTVHVKTSARTLRFANLEAEQVLIEEVDGVSEASLTMLDSHNEHLLTIKPAPDEDRALIGSMRRVPARGWGNILFANYDKTFREARQNINAVTRDMSIVTTAFAFLIAKHLVKDTNHGRCQSTEEDTADLLAYDVDEERLLEASRFLFHNSNIRRGEVESFAAQCISKALNEELLPPITLTAFIAASVSRTTREQIHQDMRTHLCGFMKKIAIFLIALAHVTNLEDCEDLMFPCVNLDHMSEHSVVQQLESWTGETPIYIKDEVWLQALAVPLISHRNHVWDLPWDKVCLVSDKGWSAWISTLGNADPFYTSAGSVLFGKGSPCRNGIWKSGIWDVPLGNRNLWGRPERAEGYGKTASLRCSEKVSWDNPYCGEGDDIFLVCARFRILTTENPIHRVGYKQLQSNLWLAQLSKRCSHTSQSSKGITLGMDIVTIAGFGNYGERFNERIMIYLTAHSIGARWLALTTPPKTVSQFGKVSSYERQIFLRGNDCCFQCTVDQVATQPGKWIIIL